MQAILDSLIFDLSLMIAFVMTWLFGCAVLLARVRTIDKASAIRFVWALLATFIFSVVWFAAFLIMIHVGDFLPQKMHFRRPEFTFALIGLIVGLLATWLTIKIIFKQSFRKAFNIWLSVLVLQIVVSIPLLLMSESGRPRELAKRAVCKTHLKGLGTAMELYHQECKVYPPTPKELVEEGYASSKNFQCPSDIQHREMAYFYLPPLETDNGETFVMCDWKGNHENVRNILRKDGNVQEFSEEAFQADLAKPYNARFAEALRKAEGP